MPPLPRRWWPVFLRRFVVRAAVAVGLVLTIRSVPIEHAAALEQAVAASGTAWQDPLPAETSEKGEQILNRSCRSCHDLRPIDIKAIDQDGWMKLVDSMIDQGAEIGAEDVPVLVAYLVKYHGALPEGPGKDILLQTCTTCHDLQRVRRQGRSPEGWLEILDAMLNEGAALSERDLPVLLQYLSRNFKPPR